VELHIDDNYMIGIKARSGGIKAHYSLVGTSSEEYPDIPVFVEDNASEISQSIFKDMLKRVSHAAALDTIKPVFNGIFLVSDSSDKLVAVATDSRRLSMISRTIANGMELAEGVIIPLKTSNELIRLLSSGGTCRFSLFENQCFFRIGETEIISRIVEGQFPNFKQVIPKEQKINVVVNTQGLVDSLRRAMVFTREPANKVILHFKKDVMVLETKTPDLGESEEEISIESDVKEELSIGINAQFLMDTLREIESDSITIGMSSQMSPVTICPEDDPDFLSVIMPIQIKST
ncbi:MAG TPA: DNA polymerase III subunit beta, partial [Bacteroidaceae bacterium]|nr:DNA polymerase III subunit beta [Bacteroidaceae bacterium]